MRPRHQPALTVRLAVLRTLAVLDVELNSLRRDAPVRAHVHPTHEPVPNVTYRVPHLHRLPALLAPPRPGPAT